MKFLITGGSGFIGSKLTNRLIASGHDVTILTRNKQQTVSKFKQKVQVIDSLVHTQTSYDVIINLAGESLTNGRWTKKKKQRIQSSRLETTIKIIDYIKQAQNKPELLLNGSAIGFYGTSETHEFSENSTPVDNDFGHHLCDQWEQKALLAEQFSVRVCLLRIGIVLGNDGGALLRMLLPFKLGLGGKMGTGNQWMSWIHVDDLLGIIDFIIKEKRISGPINATSPNPVTNSQFTKTLGKALHRPTILPVPAISLRLMFGEMADAILLKGQKVIPKKQIDQGFNFKYDRLEEALSQLLKN